MSELTWTIGSAVASALLAAGIALIIGGPGLMWTLRGVLTASATRRVSWLGAVGAVAVLLATGLRTLLQAAALAETPAAFATMLRPVLLETELGATLRLQAAASLLTLAGYSVLGRWRRTGYGVVALAAMALAVTPGLGGHPAAHDRPSIALTISVAHVLGLSLWLGTLAVLTGTARALDDAALALAVRRFHGVAAFGLGAVAASGGWKLFDIRPPLTELVASTWGIALVAKLAVFSLVALLGWWHWRRADTALADGRRRDVLRSFATELALAALLLIATGVLVNSMPPEREVALGAPANPDVVATRMYREIASPFCPGMSLASCPSDGAFRLKRRIRARLDSIGPDSVMSELAAEFGPEISGITPARGFGLVAWLAPFVGVALGALGILRWTQRSTQRAQQQGSNTMRHATTPDANDAELARLAEALRADD